MDDGKSWRTKIDLYKDATEIDVKNSEIKKSTNSLFCEVLPQQSSDQEMVSNSDAFAIKAELLVVLNIISNNELMRSCNDLNCVFKTAFPDSSIVEKFSLNPRKLSFYVTEVLGPYYRQSLLESIRKDDLYYSIIVDETYPSATKSQIQVSIRVFSEKAKRVISHHLESFFIDNAKHKNIAEIIQNSLENTDIPLSKLLVLTIDEHSSSVFKYFNDNIKKIRGNGLINCFSYYDTIQNSFKKGVSAFGIQVSDLIISTYNWFNDDSFNDNARRRQDFRNLCKDEKLPYYTIIKHDNSRPLTLLAAAVRFVELLPSIKEYFLNYLSNQSYYNRLFSYKRIESILKQKDLDLMFVLIVESGSIFKPFLNDLKSNDPMIHRIYDNLVKLDQLITSKIEEGVNKLPLYDMSSLEIGAKDEFCKNYKKHFVAIQSHLEYQRGTRMSILKGSRVSDPNHLKHKEAIADLELMLKYFPRDQMFNMVDVVKEYKSLQKENIEMSIFEYNRIDEFWSNIFEKFCYKNLEYVIKSILCIPHGQSSVLMHTEDISELNAHLNVIDTVRNFKTNIDDNLLNLAINSIKSYNLAIEKAKEEKKRKLDDLNIEIEKKQASLSQYQSTIKALQNTKNELEKIDKKTDAGEDLGNFIEYYNKIIAKLCDELQQFKTCLNILSKDVE